MNLPAGRQVMSYECKEVLGFIVSIKNAFPAKFFSFAPRVIVAGKTGRR
jgi:hypothetical protein